jgi:hypothetical protein
MGFIGSFLRYFVPSVGSAVGSAVGSGGGMTAAAAVADVVDNLFTSDEERLTKQAILARISLKADHLQAQINMAEARHRSRFVAGWRPFIGWVCGVALLWHFLFQPMLVYVGVIYGFASPPPLFDLGQLNTILFGLLGLGTLRTAEKAAGKAH